MRMAPCLAGHEGSNVQMIQPITANTNTVLDASAADDSDAIWAEFDRSDAAVLALV